MTRATVEALRQRLAERARTTLELPLRPASVLVPLLVREGELNLVFTRRSDSLSSHSGQVSFPGGKRDETDASVAATALREAEEEIGLSPACVDVLGLLDEIPTPSGFLITPVVAFVDPPPKAYLTCALEVAEVFEVPVRRLRDPALLEDQGEVERWGYRYRILAYRPDGRNIWGATARMVYVLLSLLD